MFCPQCGTNNPEGTHFCSNCGAGIGVQQAPAGVAPPAPAQPPPPGTVGPTGSAPPGGYAGAPGSYAPGPQQGQGFGSAVGGGYQTGAPAHSTVSVDFRRLGMGDLVALGGTVLLFISLFLSWYSATGEDAQRQHHHAHRIGTRTVCGRLSFPGPGSRHRRAALPACENLRSQGIPPTASALADSLDRGRPAVPSHDPHVLHQALDRPRRSGRELVVRGVHRARRGNHRCRRGGSAA